MFNLNLFINDDTKQVSGYIPRKTQDEVANAPCDSCENNSICKSELMACQHYAVWLDSRIPKAGHTKIPDKKIYKRLFGLTPPRHE